jgi:hypothetical protein
MAEPKDDPFIASRDLPWLYRAGDVVPFWAGVIFGLLLSVLFSAIRTSL